MAELTTQQRCLYNAMVRFLKEMNAYEKIAPWNYRVIRGTPITEENLLKYTEQPEGKVILEAMEDYAKVKWDEAAKEQRSRDTLNFPHLSINPNDWALV